MKLFFTLFNFILLNQINAQYSPPIIIDSNHNAFVTSIELEDLNNDNQKDIITAYLNDSVCWHKNNNLGFIKMPAILTGLGIINDIKCADIDGNGFKDLLIATKGNNNASNRVILMKNMGNGTTWNQVLIDNNIILTVVKNFFEDMDNDGDLDIISCHDVDIVQYTNNGSGTFSSRIVITPSTINEYYNLAVKDFNGDGKKDFIVNSANGTELFTANVNNTYTKQNINTSIHILLETFDAENDGDFDIMLKDLSNSNFNITSKNNGSGSFSFLQTTSFTTGNSPNPALKLVKLNADNFTDVIYRNNSIAGLMYRLNDGAGNFLAQNILDATYTYTYMNVADMDNDSKNDIVWFGSGTNNKKYLGYIKNTSTVTAINNFNQNKNIKLFPNPVINTLYITNTLPTAKYKVIIINIDGKTIYQSSTIPTKINTNKWAKGIYFLQVNNVSYKIVKG